MLKSKHALVHPKLTYANAGCLRLATADDSFHYWWGYNDGSASLVWKGTSSLHCCLTFGILVLELAKVHGHSPGTAHGCWCVSVILFFCDMNLACKSSFLFESLFCGMFCVELYVPKNWRAPGRHNSKPPYRRRTDARLLRENFHKKSLVLSSS